MRNKSEENSQKVTRTKIGKGGREDAYKIDNGTPVSKVDLRGIELEQKMRSNSKLTYNIDDPQIAVGAVVEPKFELNIDTEEEEKSQ